MIRNVLAPMSTKVPPAVRKQLLDAAIERIEAGERGWEAFLDVAQGGDGKAAAEALRALATRVLKKQPDKALIALTALSRSGHANDDDAWLLASMELARSPRDLAPSARAGDASLKEIQALAERGFDVVGKLRKDRGIELDTVYYVGFHFAERRDPIGADLLRLVIEKGGRTKIAKMAKSKLGLAEG
jgi:hypothetical protein